MMRGSDILNILHTPMRSYCDLLVVVVVCFFVNSCAYTLNCFKCMQKIACFPGASEVTLKDMGKTICTKQQQKPTKGEP